MMRSRLRQPASPEQYHTHTPIGEHDASHVADLLGYCSGTLGRCGCPRVFATKAIYAREIQQDTQLGMQIAQSFGGFERLGEHGLSLLGRAPRMKQTVPEADLQPHPQARIGHVIGLKLEQRTVASLSAFGHQRQVHP